MVPHPSPLSRITSAHFIFVLVLVYGCLFLYDTYLDLHDLLPRMAAEGVANLLFLIGMLPWGVARRVSNQRPPHLRSWQTVIRIDCLLISIVVVSYAIYSRLVFH
jgi:hypothetical protein